MHYFQYGLLKVAQISSDGLNLPNKDVSPESGTFIQGSIKNVLNFTFGLLGVIAVIIIIIAAIQYITSGGDSQKVAKAKDTIIYALVGLVVAILAFVIVNFVLDAVT